MTLALPVFGWSCLAADGFPGFAFAVLFVEVFQELRGFFGTHLAHLHGLFLGFFALAIAGIFLRLLGLLFRLCAAFAVGASRVRATGLAATILILVIATRRTFGTARVTFTILILVLVLLVLILVLLILVLILVLVLIVILILVVLLVFVLLLVLGFVDTVEEHLQFLVVRVVLQALVTSNFGRRQAVFNVLEGGVAVIGAR